MTKEEINKAAENNWNEINRQYQDGLNPYAHKVGFINGVEYANKSKWISVEILPEKNMRSCILCLKDKTVLEGFYSSFGKRFFSVEMGEFNSSNPVIYYQPLPEAP